MLRFLRIALAVSILPLAINAAAAARTAEPPLQLDTGFGQKGLVTADHSFPGFEEATAMAIGPGRHIFVAGESVDPSGTAVIVRYRRDGELEHSFGGNRGYVVLPGAAPVDALAIDGGGRVLVLSQRKTITRLTSGGDLDRTFGEVGSVQMPRLGPSTQSFQLWSLAPLPGGAIAAAGISFGSPQMVVVRLLPDGSLDPGFSDDGSRSVSFNAGTNSGAFQLKAQADGKLLLAGYADNRPALARLLPNGSLDRSFGGDGRTVVRGLLSGRITALTALRDGGILAGATGSTQRGIGGRALLLRYDAAGKFDRRFGSFATPNGESGSGAIPIAVVRARRHIFLATRGRGPSIRAYRLDGHALRLGRTPGVPEYRYFHIAAAPQDRGLILAWTPKHAPGEGVVDVARFLLH